MNTEGLERRIDACIVKEAGIGGDPNNLGEAVVNTGLYMTPFVGSGLTLRDAYKDFRDGHWLSGIGNTVLGVGTGLLDTVSIFGDWCGLGELGHAAAAALRGSKAINAAKNATRAVIGARNAARLASAGSKAYRAVRPALAATARTVDSGLDWVRGTRAARAAYNGANTALGWGRTAKNWAMATKPYQTLANGVRWLDQSGRIGHGIVGTGKFVNGFMVRPYFSPGAGILARGATREVFGNGASGYLIGKGFEGGMEHAFGHDFSAPNEDKFQYGTWNPWTQQYAPGYGPRASGAPSWQNQMPPQGNGYR